MPKPSEIVFPFMLRGWRKGLEDEVKKMSLELLLMALTEVTDEPTATSEEADRQLHDALLTLWVHLVRAENARREGIPKGWA